MIRKFCIVLFLFMFFSIPAYGAADSNYIFLIDVSGSMVGKGDGKGVNIFPKVKSAINNYIKNKVPPESVVTVIPFAEKIIEDKTFSVSENPDLKINLLNYIDNLKAEGQNTNIYGSFYRCFEKISKINENEQITILLFTDGKDNVGERSLEEMVNKFNWIKSDYPFLFVFYYFFGDGEVRGSDEIESSGMEVRSLNRNDSEFQKKLNEMLKKTDSTISDRIAEIKKEYEKMASERKLLDEKQNTLKLKENNLGEKERKIKEELARLSKEDEKRKQELEQQLLILKNEQNEIEKNRNQIKTDKDKAAIEWKKLAIEKSQRHQINKMMEEAELLSKSLQNADWERALDKYSAILKKESNNVLALDGKKAIIKKIWANKTFFQKYWYYLVSGFIMIFFLLLCVRRPLINFLKVKPIYYKLSWYSGQNDLSGEADGTIPRITFLRKRFQKTGRPLYIGKSGDIIIEHNSVADTRHAKFYREKDDIIIEKISGNIIEPDGQAQDSIRLGNINTFYLYTGSSLSEANNFSMMVRFLIEKIA